MARRSKRITEAEVERVVGLLDTWRGKLTWPLLIAAIERRTGQKYTRQALHKHPRIQTAFSLRKREGAPSDGPRQTATAQLRGRIREEAFRAQRLEKETDILYEKLLVAYANAYMMGLREDQVVPGELRAAGRELPAAAPEARVPDRQLLRRVEANRQRCRRVERRKEILETHLKAVIAKVEKWGLTEDQVSRPLPQIYRATRRQLAGAPALPPLRLGRRRA